MLTSLKQLQSYLYQREILLVGNATSILNKPKNLDSHEIICRMNRGFPQGREEFLGSRTDILFTSTKLTEPQVKKFNPKAVVWMTKDTSLMTDYLKHNCIYNPDWDEVKSHFPADVLPSTGFLCIKFLTTHIDFKILTLIGFDNFTTGSFYHPNFKQTWHNGMVEHNYILALEERRDIQWIRE